MEITLSLAQFETIQNRPKENLQKAKELIIEAKQRGSDMIVFPEMWTTGFDWDYLKSHKDEHNLIAEQIAAFAAKHKIWILGTTAHVDHSQAITNRASLSCVNGLSAATYDKTHLFFGAKEEEYIKAGQSLTTYDHGFFKSGFSICYDLRFPELFRSYALDGVKLVFMMAAFPFPRQEHFVTLCKARAIENQMYMVCVNRVGSEEIPGAGTLTYCGGSAIYDPLGEPLIRAGTTKESLLTMTIDLSCVDKVRQSFPVFQDRKEALYS